MSLQEISQFRGRISKAIAIPGEDADEGMTISHRRPRIGVDVADEEEDEDEEAR